MRTNTLSQILSSSILAISIIGTANCSSWAGSTESSNENPLGFRASSVPGSSGNLAPQINMAIQNSPNLSPEAKHINVTYEKDTVVLRGTVPTSGDKQKINSIIDQVGATNISNLIKVKDLAQKKSTKPKARIITR